MSDVRELLHAAAAPPSAPLDMEAVLARARRRRWRRFGLWTVIVAALGGLVPAGLSLAPADRGPQRVEVVKPVPRPAPDVSAPEPILPGGLHQRPDAVESVTGGALRRPGPGTTVRTAGALPAASAARPVAFVRDGQLWMMGADGSEAGFVHYGSNDASDPAWSPDGSQLAYSERGEVLVLTMSGADAGTIRSLGQGTDPTWSPDGRSLAFALGDSAGSSDVWIMAADGNGRRRLTLSPAWEHAPAWSPDGRSIAYVNIGAEFRNQVGSAGGVGPMAIHLVAPDGTADRIVVNDAKEPAFSPDGRLAYVRTDGIWSAAADGTGAVQLTHAGSGLDYGPAWTRDGAVVFARDPNARPGDSVYSSLWSVRADGSGLRRLTENGLGNDDDPAVRL